METGNISDLKENYMETPYTSFIQLTPWQTPEDVVKTAEPYILSLVLLKKLPVMYWKICTRGGMIYSLSFSKPQS